MATLRGHTRELQQQSCTVCQEINDLVKGPLMVAKRARTPDLIVAKVALDGRLRVFGPTLRASGVSRS
jgi:Ni,Fe-hydrogenase III large subunit